MKAKTSDVRKATESPTGGSALSTIFKYIFFALFDAFFLILFYGLIYNDTLSFAIVMAIAVIALNIIAFVPNLYPIRWMMPGLFLVTLFLIYPVGFTISTAFTNLGDGHLLSKEQSISLIVNARENRYVPEDAQTYSWALFQSQSNPDDFALWLTRTTEDGTKEVAFAPLDAPIQVVEHGTEDTPETFQGYQQLSRIQMTNFLGTVQGLVFGQGEDTAAIRTGREAARPLINKFEYDEVQDAIVDQETGATYYADDSKGIFTDQGKQLNPGYRAIVGFSNFTRLASDPGLRGPITTIFIWTVMFAFLSVFTTFWLGLFMALILNDAAIPGKRIIRSLLIIPYAMPGVISIVVWRMMLNPNIGYITTSIADAYGVNIPWYSNPFWARSAAILVNLWLGYPYMMLITSGALQSIPSDIYEAAAVDGATPYDRFWRITLPMLLVTVGPLLIASFTYNFNNFLLVEALTKGDPPIAGSIVPAGYTDILINYTYNSAFVNNAEYGYASAITIVIFAIVGVITLMQYNFTKTWEEVGENV